LVALKCPPSITHERGVGSPCGKCKDCSGLDLHFWRKTCKNCGCKYEDHKIIVNDCLHDAIVHNLLHMNDDVIEFEEDDNNNNNITDHPYVKEFTKQKNASKFQSMQISFDGKKVSSRKRSLGSTEEEMKRQQILLNQIPPQDFDMRYCHDLSEEEKEEFALYLKLVQTESIGKGISNLYSSSASKDCNDCNSPIASGVKYISTERMSEKIWHSHCFKCEMCKEPLIDEIYFQYSDNIYCGRHFGENYKQRCTSCDELIFSSEYTNAEEREWHKKHFCCFSCDHELSNEEYIYENMQPYCTKCYRMKFAIQCHTCKLVIPFNAQRLSFEGMDWHSDKNCFKCFKCNKGLLDADFIERNEVIYCSEECFS